MNDIGNRAKRSRLARCWLEILLVLGHASLLTAGITPSPEALVTVTSRYGTDHQIPVEMVQGVLHVSVADVADILQARCFWSPEKEKIEMAFGAHTLVVTLSNPVVVIDRTAYQMPQSTILQGGSILAPAQPLLHILGQVTPDYMTWDQETSRVVLLSSDVNITGLSIDQKKNGTQIIITADETLPFDYSLDSSDWLTLTILGGRLKPEIFTIPAPNGLMLSMKAFQFNESCQISLQLAENHSSYQVFQEKNPSRIVVLLRAKPGDLTSSSSTSQSVELQPNPDLALFDLIVLDAGHGGKDPGALGPSGLQEKDVVLDVTMRLAELLRQRLGVQVILTRDDNTYIPLQRRTEIANSTGADLFVSIHANASRRRSAGGFETFFLSPAKNDEARAVAMQENASLKFDEEFGASAELSDEDFILRDIVNDMLQSSFLKESEDLAATIQKKMKARLDISNRGIDQAGFFVLVGAKMPSVLVEIAFISNAHEEKLLTQKTFRQNVAEAVYEGIKEFKSKYESKM